MKKFAVGESDFKNIISDNYYYVDKSLFIKEILDRGGERKRCQAKKFYSITKLTIDNFTYFE
jgi:hypothetical protein